MRRPANHFAMAILLAAACLAYTGFCEPPKDEKESILAGFVQPPVDCRPHTRWWWMGNALRKEDIARQLDQMKAQGIGGVEQVSMGPVYVQGNHDYLSPGYFELLRYAVEQAQARGMEFSINFGGPGWIWGGTWVPKEDQSKVLLASMTTLTGPQKYSGPLPEEAALNPRDIPRSMPYIAKEDRLIKVVAARLAEGALQPESLTDLSVLAENRSITWNVPEGQWQLMAFWITQRDNADAVDHLSVGAMTRYCETLGGQYAAAIGDHFSKTVDSFFSDSFEVPIYRNGLYWSDGLFEAFAKEKGYDLVPWLPALWWEVGGLSAKIRYDVNEFLHTQGMTAFFATFLDWCERHGVRARIQPYGFVTDNIEGAGAAHIPEMEITAGEKDAVPWFDTRIGPKQYVASGAHLYGRNIVSAEAFTYLHWEPYRATLEELKIATDGYFYTGANKIYNHGYIASPEEGIIPTRGFYAAIRISPENVWWPYYHYLAEYTARCCWLLRQGRPAAEAAVYSPLANQWAMSVLNARKWSREFNWSDLGKLLMANGYGFDLVNDDILQRHAVFDEEQLHLGEMTYRVLILPEVSTIPVETFRQIEAFVRQGGSVIALETIPRNSAGMRNYAENDAEVRRIASELFSAPGGTEGLGRKEYGSGRTYFLKLVLQREDPLDDHSAPFDPFLKALRQCAAPNMNIDLVRAGQRTNEGVVCTHRQTETMDIYFVANVNGAPRAESIGFLAAQGEPSFWNPCTGERRPVYAYTRDGQYTSLSLSLAPYESRFIVFENTGNRSDSPHLEEHDFADIAGANRKGFTALADHNGRIEYRFFDGTANRGGMALVEDLPALYEVSGAWDIAFFEENGEQKSYRWSVLKSWTENADLRHFSGRACYKTTFNIPAAYFAPDTHLRLSLGAVGNVAEIRLNQQDVGVQWMTGQDFPIDGLALVGENTLEICVTNTLINHVSGLQAFPEVAADLQPFLGKGIQDVTPEASKLIGFEPLPRSGLLGPVRIAPLREVHVSAP